LSEVERKQKAIHEKLREELTLVQMDRHASELEEGVRFDRKRLVGTGLTLPVFNYLAPAEDSEVRMVDQTGIEPVTS
jgi:hypothetical protein